VESNRPLTKVEPYSHPLEKAKELVDKALAETLPVVE